MSRRRRRPAEFEGPDFGPLGQGSNLDHSRQGSGVKRLTPHLAFSPERDALMDEAVSLFSRRYGRSFSREEAGQAMDRLVGFFALLYEWKRRGESDGPDSRLAA